MPNTLNTLAAGVARSAAIVLSCAGAGLVVLPAHAQQVPTPASSTQAGPTILPNLNRETITLGVVGAYLPDYEGSNDYRATPAPAGIGSIKGYQFVLAGNQLAIDLIRDKPGSHWDLQAGPIASLNFNRSSLKDISDLRVRALGKRSTALELGGVVGIGKTGVLTSPYDTLSVSLSYRHDVTSVHDSGIWQPVITYYTPLSIKAAVGIYGSAEIVEDGYARTYYSVSAAQSAASGLAVYDAKGGLKSWNVGLIGTYSLTGNLLHGLKVIGTGSYGRVVDSIGRSPLVKDAGSPTQWFGALGLAYTF